MSKSITSLVLAVIWLSGFLHVELEGAGFLPEHTHLADFFHSSHPEDAARGHGSQPHGDVEHDELVARNNPGWVGLFFALLAFAGLVLGTRALLRLFRRARLLAEVDFLRPDARLRPWSFGLGAWPFLRRCTSPALAPPTTL